MNQTSSGSRPRGRRLLPACLLAALFALAAYAHLHRPDAPAPGRAAAGGAEDAASARETPASGGDTAAPSALRAAGPRVRVRDSATGAAVEAEIALQAGDWRADGAMRVDRAGSRLAAPVAGRFPAVVRAPGYAELATTIGFGDGAALPMTIWLAPARPAPELDVEALRAVECGECSVLWGHVYDARSGRPLAGASVRTDEGTRAVTDARGRFDLLVAIHGRAPTRTEALPASAALVVEAPGYRHKRLVGVPLYHDASHYVIDLEPGGGRDVEDATQRQVRALQGRATAADAAAPAETAPRPDGAAPVAGPPARALQLPASVAVPGSIRVGTGCSGRACTGVAVYGLEDYVGRGLDDEWIASWHPESLAAGAVAYRSYAAWYVANPVSSQYDICNSTSCQVFGAAAVSATVAAAAATRGVLLTRDGRTAAFSEYSSENNAWDDPGDGRSCSNPDLSCGNGFNGSPANGWPCLSDPVGRGRGCFGHGRGMSQWGTQRWAADHGRDWRWIADHYYNANGRPGGMRNAFLANLPDAGARILDDFEAGAGRFGTPPTYSGSTVGVSATSAATRDCGVRRGGACSLRVLLRDDPGSAADWSVRLLSAAGAPAGNAPLAREGGRIGFWVWSGGSGMGVGVGIDDADGTERSVVRGIPANQWTYVEWRLADAAQWNAWAGGDGAISAATVTLDAIWLYRAQTAYDVNVYIDDVQIRN